jgi:hypothetical protein
MKNTPYEKFWWEMVKSYLPPGFTLDEIAPSVHDWSCVQWIAISSDGKRFCGWEKESIVQKKYEDDAQDIAEEKQRQHPLRESCSKKGEYKNR